MLSDQHVARDAARPVQLVQRHGLLVRRHLENRVRRGVHDPLAGPLVHFPQLGDDRRTGSSLVAQPSSPGPPRELVEQLPRKAVRVGAKRLREEHAAHLPVPRRAVFPRRRWKGHTVCRRWSIFGREAQYRPAAPEPQPLQVRQPQPAHRPRHVAKRVASRVPIGRVVGTRPDAEPVEHDDRCALQS